MTNFKFATLQAVLVALSITFISGCNTVQGIGRDMQQGGQEIQKAATEHHCCS